LRDPVRVVCDRKATGVPIEKSYWAPRSVSQSQLSSALSVGRRLVGGDICLPERPVLEPCPARGLLQRAKRGLERGTDHAGLRKGRIRRRAGARTLAPARRSFRLVSFSGGPRMPLLLRVERRRPSGRQRFRFAPARAGAEVGESPPRSPALSYRRDFGRSLDGGSSSKV